MRTPNFPLGAAPLGCLVTLGATLVLTSTAAAAPQVPGVGEIGGPTRVLTPAEMTQWLDGRALFDKNFHRSRGLGTPFYNADSCRGCHEDPVMGGAGSLELNVSRMGLDNGGAGPFQNVAGGQILSKLHVPWAPGREEYVVGVPDVFEQRQTPALFGLGLMDSIFESAILANEDPDDLDADGVRGIARRLTIGKNVEIGRFGWKAQIPRVSDFVKDGFGNELGITSSDDGRGFAIVSDADAIPDPELTTQEFDDMTFFLTLLGPPPRTGSQAPEVLLGEQLFSAVGCAKCHSPSLAGTDGPVPLYSDLLLHNVMPPGFRGMEEPGAPSGFYRTAPLWGIRHSAPYMHDGRAETLVQAIRSHFGEATQVVNRFERLSRPNKAALLAFLADL